MGAGSGGGGGCVLRWRGGGEGVLRLPVPSRPIVTGTMPKGHNLPHTYTQRIYTFDRQSVPGVLPPTPLAFLNPFMYFPLVSDLSPFQNGE